MKNLILVYLSFLSPILYAGPPPLIPGSLILKTGESIDLKLGGKGPVWITKQKIIKAVPVEDKIRVFALKAGDVSIGRGTLHKEIQVLDSSAYTGFLELKKILKALKGLRIEIQEGEVAVKGELLRTEDWMYLSDRLSSLDLPYLFQARIPKELSFSSQLFVREQFKKNNLSHLNWNAEEPSEVRIPHSLKDQQKRIDRALANLGIRSVLDKQLLEPQPLIRLRVLFAEVSRNFQRQFGLSWPNSYSIQVFPGLKGEEPWSSVLKLVESDSFGRVLATPELICRSGGSAEFVAGGEFPIRLTGYRSQSVEWKKHGVVLKFSPKTDAFGNFSIEVSTELSVLDMSQAVDGVPGLKSNHTSTQFDLKKSQTLILSGLVRESVGTSKEGLPYLSQVPILGSLFSSEHFLKGRSELIVLVRPEIVEQE